FSMQELESQRNLDHQGERTINSNESLDKDKFLVNKGKENVDSSSALYATLCRLIATFPSIYIAVCTLIVFLLVLPSSLYENVVNQNILIVISVVTIFLLIDFVYYVGTEMAENSQAISQLQSKEWANSVEIARLKAALITVNAALTDNIQKELFQVYADQEGIIYDVLLNYTNVAINSNKYCKMQLLQNGRQEFKVRIRSGRIGYQNESEKFFSDLTKAQSFFKNEFRKKTLNSWPISNSDFEPKAKKYIMIEMDAVREQKQEQEINQCEAKSKLDSRLQNLLNRLFSLREMGLKAASLDYDATILPLGMITQQQIDRGYNAISNVAELIRNLGGVEQLTEAVSRYYTYIPHKTGYRTRPVLINTTELVDKEIKLLKLLSDIVFAIRTLEEEKQEANVNPVDRHYNSLNCGLTPLNVDQDEFQMLSDCLQNSRGSHHPKLKLMNIFKVEREGEQIHQQNMNELGNKKLLWHGSSLNNLLSILPQGLRIPDAPMNGWTYGEGVYFTDVAAEAALYCRSYEDETGLLLLAEVALGSSQLITEDRFVANTTGYHSRHAVGKLRPDPNKEISLAFDNGKYIPYSAAENDELVRVALPCGEPVTHSQPYRRGRLVYNEFVVLNSNQIILRYLVEVKIH
ncbi:hypothetical protein PFISCL1PPCAC_9087, partial [Pristionchus fissidentatus]